jgi:hypothetical protein
MSRKRRSRWLLVTAIAVVWASQARLASAEIPAPALGEPEPSVSVWDGEPFVVDGVVDGGDSQIQFSSSDDFATPECDTGWIENGFWSQVWWDFPGPIGFSEVSCELDPGDYYWRARTRSGQEESAWSDVESFTYYAEPIEEPYDPEAEPWGPVDAGEPDGGEPTDSTVESCGEPVGSDPDPILEELMEEEPEADPSGEGDYEAMTEVYSAEGTAPPTPLRWPSGYYVWQTQTQLSTGLKNAAFDYAAGLDSEQTEYECGGDREGPFQLIRRKTRLVDLHVAPHFKAEWYMGTARETRVESAFRIDQGSWHVGVASVEEKSRGQHAALRRTGPYHRRALPVYQYGLYRRCYQPANSNDEECRYAWLPYKWTGEVAPGTATLESAPFHRENSVRIYVSGDDWGTESSRNRTFGAGVTIVGLSLASRAGYSGNTKLTFTTTGQCSRWYVYGADDLPVDSPVVYSRTEGCS